MKKIIEIVPPIFLRNYFSINKNIRNQRFHDVTLTLRGRDAIALAVQHFGLQKHDTVLLPAYLCRVIYTPFHNFFTPEFYDIREDLSIDVETIESILKSRKIKVLYVIHYFGFLHRNIAQLSKLCKKYGVLLWEDHAHSALSHFSYDYADAMLFSFRKLLPIPDGGGLWLANSSPLSIQGALASNITSMLILAKRSRLGMGKRVRSFLRPVYYHSTASVYKGIKEIIPQPISYMSKRLIRHSDIESIFNIRRSIFDIWQELFSKSRLKPVFSKLPEDVCPQSFPIWLQIPQELRTKLWSFNVNLRNLWPLDKQMKEKCPTAYELSNSVSPLPIYPGLPQSDMERIMTLLEQYGKSPYLNRDINREQRQQAL